MSTYKNIPVISEPFVDDETCTIARRMFGEDVGIQCDAGCNTLMWDNFTTSWDTHFHLYCHKCKGHYFKGKQWTQIEWDAWLDTALDD